MKPVLTLLTTLLFAPLAMVHATDQPVDADPRLHSDGKGWKLNQATIKDPKRPRVLLIGDSILSGYMNHAIKALEGKDKFHWNPPAYKILGEKCVESVLKALPNMNGS